jgi:tetraacyldisaccharide 4'-kinase
MIILDDAFQRRDVARNANILVMHGAAPFGNGLCLPAGPLREPMAGRSRADFAIIFNPAPLAPHEAPPYFGLTTYRLYLTINPAEVAPLRGQRVLAFAGIGQPDKFFNSLSIAGVHVVHRVALPDHVRYTPALQRHLKALAHQHQAVLATTAKDAIKLPPGFAHTIKVAIEGEDLENVLAALGRLLGR